MPTLWQPCETTTREEEEESLAMGSEDSLQAKPEAQGHSRWEIGNCRRLALPKLSTPFAAFLQFSAAPQFHCMATSTRHCQHDSIHIIIGLQYTIYPPCVVCVSVVCVWSVSVSSNNRNLKVPSAHNVLDLQQPSYLSPPCARLLGVMDIRHNIYEISRREKRSQQRPN